MTRLIDADALLHDIEHLNDMHPRHIINLIENAPTVEQDSEPVAKVLFRQDEDGLEPVAFYSNDEYPDKDRLKDKFVLLDICLSPPKREWVELKLSQVKEIRKKYPASDFDFAFAIEAKLKEVNGYEQNQKRK